MLSSTESKLRRPGDESADTLPQARRAHHPLLLLALLGLLIAGITVFVHRPVMTAQAKSFDDEEAIVENRLIQNPSLDSAGRFFSEVTLSSVVRGYYRPLTLTSLMLDWAMGGRPDDFRVFHRTSLVLHVGSTLLLMGLCYQIFRQPIIAALAGLLFGVHPLTVEPVAWVMERKTLLAAFFAFASLIAYVHSTRQSRGLWLSVSAFLFLLSLLAKPTSTPLPLIMLLMDVWPLRRFGRRAIVEKIPFFALSIVFAILCTVCEQKVNPLSIPAKLSPLHLPLRLCWLTVFYPCKILLPINLSSVYMLPNPLSLSNGWVLLALVVAMVTTAAIVISSRWTPALWTTAAMFYLGLAPTMGFVGYSWVAASDKYVYLPAVALVLAAGWIMHNIWHSSMAARKLALRIMLIVVVLAAGSALGIGTRDYLDCWQTTELLAEHQVRLAPHSAEAQYSHGKILHDKGDLNAAIEAYTHAINLKSYYAEAFNNRANAYASLGDYNHAFADYDHAIRLRPDYAEAFNNRGSTFGDVQVYDRAIADCSTAIDLRPGYAEAYTNRSAIFIAIQAYDQAIADASQAIQFRPDMVKAYNNRANAYLALKDYDRALSDYRNAIELKPDYAEAYHNLAVGYFLLKQYDEAWRYLKTCRQLGGQTSPEFIQALAAASGRSE